MAGCLQREQETLAAAGRRGLCEMKAHSVSVLHRGCTCVQVCRDQRSTWGVGPQSVPTLFCLLNVLRNLFYVHECFAYMDVCA